MNVAVMFSGGKDSCYAVKYCLDKGWNVTLVAVKPVSDEAYLWHYATVELTPLQAEAMHLPLILIKCDEIGAEKEARCLEPVLANLNADALVMGGVGLQRTQIREISRVASKYGIKTIVPYEHYTSEQLLMEELESGLEILITEVAASGLDKEWLGRKINDCADELKTRSGKFGFDVLGEGGSYNTFVTDAPHFRKKIELENVRINWDEKTRSGHLTAGATLIPKKEIIMV